jgi:hypothetical protein
MNLCMLFALLALRILGNAFLVCINTFFFYHQSTQQSQLSTTFLSTENI